MIKPLFNVMVCTIIDFAIPYDSRFEDKEKEKIEKYQDIARELKYRVKVVPIVIGALGSTPKRLDSWLGKIGIETKISEIQKTVILLEFFEKCLRFESC